VGTGIVGGAGMGAAAECCSTTEARASVETRPMRRRAWKMA
jgi:hypothetical protein